MAKKERDKYRGAPDYFIVFNELVKAARYRGFVTYQEMAHLLGLPISGDFMGTEIGHVLGAISEDEIGRGRPMLSAIAVKVNGKPGSGFFTLARELDKLTDANEDEFWKQEVEKVHEHWRRKF